MTLNIRQYKSSDLLDLLAVWEKATRLAHPFMTDEFIQQEARNIEEIYIPNTVTWIAETDGKLNGFLSLIGNEVGAIFVNPNDHGNGIGLTLMNKARDSHDVLEVEVFKSNSIGRSFYDNYGFVLLEEKFHEPTGQPLLRLRYEDR